jgi:hypothetical protein
VEYPRIVYTDLSGLFCKVLDGPLRSADDFVGLEEEGWRDRQAQRLDDLEVDAQLKIDVRCIERSRPPN